ncbi:hypothetical protein PHYC_01739 [Phycisphaerales bacterium]|nr:hypothetical protein PHYC_01739 [Phycisphaerales bacterium]
MTPANPMTRPVPLFAMTLLALSALAAARIAHEPSAAQSRLAGAAKEFLAALRPDLVPRARLPFEDRARTDWHFVPRQRPGVTLKALSPKERAAAHNLLRAALSSQGYLKAEAIMSLDAVLRELEQAAGGPGTSRDPELYTFAVFGDPAPDHPWAWRVEGHHLSLNFTCGAGEPVATTPSFFGANPAEVRTGPRAGLRVLAQEEDLARALLASLTPSQRARAVIAAEAPRDILLIPGRGRDALGEPSGLAASEMTDAQRDLLSQLLDEFVSNLKPDLAEAPRQRIRQALPEIHFAWAGSTERARGHYYRLHAPTFAIEYDNTQDHANHVHTVWRDFENDFGDALLSHYREEHPAP